MQAEFLAQKKIPFPINTVEGGSFGFESDECEYIQWRSCREDAAKLFESSIKGLYFAHYGAEGSDVAQFITKIEDILFLDEKPHPEWLFKFDRTCFRYTNFTSILWVEPSLFWKTCVARRSLFTILLRGAMHYHTDVDDFDAALFATDYASSTKGAILRFLLGHTKYVKQRQRYDDEGNPIGFEGWVNAFSGKTQDEIKVMLVDPHKEPGLFWSYGMKTIL